MGESHRLGFTCPGIQVWPTRGQRPILPYSRFSQQAGGHATIRGQASWGETAFPYPSLTAPSDLRDNRSLDISDRLSIVTNDVRLDVVTVNKLDELSVALLGSLLTVTWFVPQ